MTGSTRPSDDDAGEHRLFAFTLERIVFFSDAVFAIAITLLAIDLRLPALPAGQTDASLLEELGSLWPSFLAVALSFSVIAAYWIGHYRGFRHILDVDGRLITLNFAFLFCIVLLPFTTSVISTQGGLASACIVYAALGLVTGLAAMMIWVYPAQVAHLVAPAVTPLVARHVTYRLIVVPVIFAVSIPAAIIWPPLAWVLWFLTAPIQGLVTRRFPAARTFAMGEAGR